MRNLVLIGMPGTGKSTIGGTLALRLRRPLVDTDRLLAKAAGKPLPAILAEEGLDAFLEREGGVGAHLRCERCVIATGGSMVLSEAAMENLRKDSLVIWLDTELGELERRIRRHADRGIAAAPGATVRQIEAQRRPYYEKYADLHVQGGGKIAEVAERILQTLRTQHPDYL
ncbi:MAG: shikimate kinase [Clostridiales bacterium]|nr:shikimate kinase [Clostridiales bacterium]